MTLLSERAIGSNSWHIYANFAKSDLHDNFQKGPSDAFRSRRKLIAKGQVKLVTFVGMEHSSTRLLINLQSPKQCPLKRIRGFTNHCLIGWKTCLTAPSLGGPTKSGLVLKCQMLGPTAKKTHKNPDKSQPDASQVVSVSQEADANTPEVTTEGEVAVVAGVGANSAVRVTN